MDRAKRNAPLSRRQRKRNRRLSRVRARIEKVFGTFKRIYGMERVRYVGLLKNGRHKAGENPCWPFIRYP